MTALTFAALAMEHTAKKAEDSSDSAARPAGDSAITVMPMPGFGASRRASHALPRPAFGLAPPVSIPAAEPPVHTASRSLPRVLVEPGQKSAFDGDFLIAAVGPVLVPSYEGSDSHVILPGIAVAGRFKGVGISPRAAGLALDFIKDKSGAALSFSLGPVVRLRNNRVGAIKDPVVERLGKLSRVVEGGIALGVTIKKVLNPHDQLSLGTDIRWDISGKGSGRIVVPSVSYLTPISRAQVIGINASAEFADARYARYNYGISASGSAASGLPAFQARGGLKAINVGAFTGRDLSGNLLDGGFAVAAGVMYSRLTGSAARTPLTTLRGSRNQWTAAVGLTYTF